jgi:hypothetical protein
MKVRIACIALLAVLLGVSRAFCFSLSDVNVNTGLIMVFTTDPLAAPSPIVTAIGASLPIGIADPFFFEPGIDIFGLNYSYDGARAVPATIEEAGGFFTANILIGAQAGVRFTLTKSLEIGGTAGADLLIRFPLEFENTGPASLAGREPAMAYFYGGLRFLYPETRLFLKWQVAQNLGLLFSLRALYPIFHIWDGEGLPFLDQLMIALTLGFAIRL